MTEKTTISLEVKGQEPLEACPPIFSNFVAVSRVGTEVQFEFIFLDINQLAVTAQQAQGGTREQPIQVIGKTVSKIVVPASSLLQMKSHLDAIFVALKEDTGESKELSHARTGS